MQVAVQEKPPLAQARSTIGSTASAQKAGAAHVQCKISSSLAAALAWVWSAVPMIAVQGPPLKAGGCFKQARQDVSNGLTDWLLGFSTRHCQRETHTLQHKH